MRALALLDGGLVRALAPVVHKLRSRHAQLELHRLRPDKVWAKLLTGLRLVSTLRSFQFDAQKMGVPKILGLWCSPPARAAGRFPVASCPSPVSSQIVECDADICLELSDFGLMGYGP